VLELVERTVTERAAGAGTGDITVATVPKTWREESSKQEALKRVRERELLDLQLAKARGEVVARVDAEALAAAVVARARRALQSTHAAMLAKVPEKWRTKLGPIMDEAVEEWAKALAEGDP
jgi:ABC-type transporter Mla MlaB component